jgi:hypothetical protein
MHIGMPPAGSLNRTRLYLPARTLWGAVTAELARTNSGDGFPDYPKMGYEIALNCRFTYFYPAEKKGDCYLVWLPQYRASDSFMEVNRQKSSSGLIWRRSDDEIAKDRQFQRKLLDARLGTAIVPETGSAEEGSLREMECIQPWWRKEKDSFPPEPVYLYGYAFLWDNAFRKRLENVEYLSVGGDTRYGLGRLELVQFEEIDPKFFEFGEVDLEQSAPLIRTNSIKAHVFPSKLDFHPTVIGDLEIPSHRGVSNSNDKHQYAWKPGSYLTSQLCWWIDSYGYWEQEKE